MVVEAPEVNARKPQNLPVIEHKNPTQVIEDEATRQLFSNDTLNQLKESSSQYEITDREKQLLR